MNNLYKKIEDIHPDFKPYESVLKSSEQTAHDEFENLLIEKDAQTEEIGMQTIKRVLQMAYVHSSKGNLIKYGISRDDTRALQRALNKVNIILQQIN